MSQETHIALTNKLEIGDLLRMAIFDRTRLEVRLKGRENELFTSHFLERPEGGEAWISGQENYVMISPLEPATGNFKIRSSKSAFIGFDLGMKYFETGLDLMDVTKSGEEFVIKLSYPKRLIVYPRREEIRSKPLIDWHIPIQVRKPDLEPLSGRLVDISSGGLAFSTEVGKSPLEPGDGVVIELNIAQEGEAKILFTLTGTIRLRAVKRSEDDTREVRELFGVSFGLLNFTQKIQLGELINQIHGRYEAVLKKKIERYRQDVERRLLSYFEGIG